MTLYWKCLNCAAKFTTFSIHDAECPDCGSEDVVELDVE